MKYVADASFVAALFLPDEASARAAALAGRMGRDGATAPGLLQLEVTNILIMAERRKRISGSQVKQLSEAFEQLPILLQPSLTPGQRAEVLRLAQKHQLTAYDAVYLELAMRLNLRLASLDKDLLAAARAEGISPAIQ